MDRRAHLDASGAAGKVERQEQWGGEVRGARGRGVRKPAYSRPSSSARIVLAATVSYTSAALCPRGASK